MSTSQDDNSVVSPMATPPTLTPVPMDVLQPPAPPVVRTQPPQKSGIETNSKGQYIRNLGDTETLMVFIPCCYPFIACCWENEMNVAIFDDGKQTISVEKRPGYFCFPLCTCWSLEQNVTPYSQVGNVGLVKTGMVTSCTVTHGDLSQSAHEPLYYFGFIDRGRKITTLGNFGNKQSIAKEVLELHEFLYGRSNPNYSKPDIDTLIMER